MRQTAEGRTLLGKKVAFTGHLASMTQIEAEDLVRAHGGHAVRFPGRRTDYLVVGQDGWPLRDDGRVSRKLERARTLQEAGCAISIVEEREFLDRLGLGEQGEQIHKLYTTAQLTRILGIPRDRIRHWVRWGLLRPARTVHRLAYFDFRQVTSARALWELMRAGIPPERIRRSLRQLKSWMPRVDDPLAELQLLDHHRQILVRLDDGQVAGPDGQLYFPFPQFAPGTAAAPLTLPSATPSAEEWFDRGLHSEEEGRLEEAEESYREALRLEGPWAELCFNLGNVVYHLGHKQKATECYLEAVDLDPNYVEAWNNLGNVVCELGRRDEAIRAYHRALALEPRYADAHYNLAETLCQVGRTDEARRHWAAYLEQDSRGSWADHARERLNATE
ncbi:MAG: tetratricopeptide repeat protein [Planctomycetota bacterium]|nr:tetratricopeptide repeat protein [Planctomycetota bacterium]